MTGDRVNTGTAYEHSPGNPLSELALVGRDTPTGEVLRRYWQPVGLASDATSTPRQVRVLGEDLVLFRDGRGQPGLLYPRCCHRGASLYYGGVEDEGIRCCYHGWLFDVEGHCLEQPCEPDGGMHRDRVRQPWYPVYERYGLVWAYMGPPEREPAFPIYDVMENLGDGEHAFADDSSLGGGGPQILDFNWLSHWENVLDPFHVPILHARFSGNQFVPEMGIIPEVTFSYTDVGVRATSTRELPDGRRLKRVTETIAPNLRVVPDPRLGSFGQTDLLGWVLPIDDTHFRIYTVFKSDDPDRLTRMRSTFADDLTWSDMTPEQHRDYPGDYEAQKSQGRISLHSEDHLTTTDQGVTMLRRFMAKQARLVAEGSDPAGVVIGRGETLVTFASGNYLQESSAAESIGASG